MLAGTHRARPAVHTLLHGDRALSPVVHGSNPIHAAYSLGVVPICLTPLPCSPETPWHNSSATMFQHLHPCCRCRPNTSAYPASLGYFVLTPYLQSYSPAAASSLDLLAAAASTTTEKEPPLTSSLALNCRPIQPCCISSKQGREVNLRPRVCRDIRDHHQ